METSVRYVPTQRVFDKDRGEETLTGTIKPALCFRGNTYALGLISGEEGTTTLTLTLPLHDKSPLVMYGVEEYPVHRFINHFERIMETKPISPEALKLIQTWPNNPEDFNSEPDAPNQPPHSFKRQTKTKPPHCIATLATEMEVTATKIRKFLRSKGFHAPYENEAKIRTALKGYK